MPALSLIIAVYKNISALDLILRGLEEQSFRDFEVIIAEDNDGIEMKNFIKTAQKRHFFTIKHIFQADNGFRKDKALNKAVAISEADYTVFIDGDCILHKHFLKAHFENREDGLALFGRRVMLSEKMTTGLYNNSFFTIPKVIAPYGRLVIRNEQKKLFGKGLVNRFLIFFSKKIKNLFTKPLPKTSFIRQNDKRTLLDSITYFKMLITHCKRMDCAFYLPFLPSPIQTTTGIWGCNWSIHKKHLIAVNGFDEDYVKPGFGEDTDIEWRLFQHGIKLKKIKYKAIQYHLHHKENYADTLENEKLMLKKRIDRKVFCKNGLNQYL
jgi:glycosyltransferase involved in cell wall biosynthesis